MVDTAVSAYTQMLNRPWEFDELFYWSPDLPELIIKQAHMVKRRLQSLQANDPFASPVIRMPTGEACTCSVQVHDQNLYLMPNGVSQLLYPGWAPALYQFKASNLIFTPRDQWFFNLPDSDPAKYAWRIGLEHLWQSTPDLWKNNPADIMSGFKDMYSRHYDIGF
jgi:molybdopterin-biosynthesis enzyme MoeA-like protein